MKRWQQGIAWFLLGLTVVFTFLGAVGSICISWFPEQYDFPQLVPYKPVYQTATIFTFVAGFLGLAALAAGLRHRPAAYRRALAALVLGLLTAGTKMAFSARLRGSTAPTNMRFYLTALTLLVWLASARGLRPRGTDATPGAGSDAGGLPGAAALLLVGGLVVLTTPWWAGPTHTLGGTNWVLVLAPHLLVAGGLMVVAGLFVAARAVGRARQRPRALSAPAPVSVRGR